jgi:ABC-type branched-subunit amino acid transport system permease subunit
MSRLDVSFWVGAIIAIIVVIALSLVVGTICFRFRLREFYFAVVTLAFSEMMRLVILNWNSFTNGSLGINLTMTPAIWLPGGVVPVAGTRMWYYLSLVSLLFVVFVCTRVVQSWMGRCLAAIRLNDELAETLGINVFLYKLISFLIGNTGAAIAGALYAFYLGYIEPAISRSSSRLPLWQWPCWAGARRLPGRSSAHSSLRPCRMSSAFQRSCACCFTVPFSSARSCCCPEGSQG